MSNTTNTELYDRAEAMLDVWVNTMHARLIQRALDAQDLEALRYHVANAEREDALEADNDR